MRERPKDADSRERLDGDLQLRPGEASGRTVGSMGRALCAASGPPEPVRQSGGERKEEGGVAGLGGQSPGSSTVGKARRAAGR